MFSMLESGILYDVKIFAENSVGRGRTPCVTTGFGDQSRKHINNFYACIAVITQKLLLSLYMTD